jgi:hypothetical protein
LSINKVGAAALFVSLFFYFLVFKKKMEKKKLRNFFGEEKMLRKISMFYGKAK